MTDVSPNEKLAGRPPLGVGEQPHIPRCRLTRGARIALPLTMILALQGAAACSSGRGALSPRERIYIERVTLGAEHGGALPLTHKWATDIRLAVRGQPNASDRSELALLLKELQTLILPRSIQRVNDSPNFMIHFVSEGELAATLPEFRPGNEGYCWADWNDEGEIEKATVVISTGNENERLRRHLIREEITQCLGPLRDDCRDPSSIFYCGYSETTEFSAMDRVVLRALYNPRVPARADRRALRAALRRLEW